MPKKIHYTIEQHEKLGKELQDMRERLSDIYVDLSGAYPLKTSTMAGNALKSIDKLRCIMDDRVCEENPQAKDLDVVRIYYRAGRED